MSILTYPLGFIGGGKDDFYNGVMENSLRFEDGDSPILTRTPATSGNQRIWTLSWWAKRGNLSTSGTHVMFGAGVGGSNYWIFRLNGVSGDGYINSHDYISGTSALNYQSTSRYRDPSAWYHFCVTVDTTKVTAAERYKVRVNNVEPQGVSGDTIPSQNFLHEWPENTLQQIGYGHGGHGYWDGLMTDIYYIDGYALGPESFAEWKNGIWIPKAYEGPPPLLVDSSGKNQEVSNANTSLNLVSSDEAYLGNTSIRTEDAASSQIRWGNSEDFTFGTGAFTMEFWAYSTSGTGPPADSSLGQDSWQKWGGGSQSPAPDATHQMQQWWGGGTSWSWTTNNGSGSTNWSGTLSINLSQKWAHISIVRDSHSIKFFINGHLQKWYAGGSTANSTFGVGRNTFDWTMSNQAGSTSGWAGFIDEIRMVKGEALPPRFYFGSTYGDEAGGVLAHRATSAHKFVDDERTVLLVSAQNANNTTRSVSMVDESGVHLDNVHFSNSTALEYPTQDGDSVGRQYTISGPQHTTKESFIGNTSSIVFDGVDDYAVAADSDDWTFGTNGFTVDCWVRWSSVPTSTNYIWGQSVGNDDYFYLYWHPTTTSGKETGRLYFQLRTGSSAWLAQDLAGGTAMAWRMNSGEWHHLSVVREAAIGNVIAYVDGNYLNSVAVVAANTLNNLASTWGLGATGGNNAGNTPLGSAGDGAYIDEMRVVNGSADKPHIKWTHTQTAGAGNKDAYSVAKWRAHGHEFTDDNATSLLLHGSGYVQPKGYYFDGTGADYIQSGANIHADVIGSNTKTMAVWFSGVGAGDQVIAHFGDRNTGDWFAIYRGTTTLQGSTYGGDVTGWAGSPINDDPQLAVLVYDHSGTNYSPAGWLGMYFGGVLVSAKTDLGTSHVTTSAGKFTLGTNITASNDIAYHFNGYIYGAAVWNVPLTSAQIKDLHDAGPTADWASGTAINSGTNYGSTEVTGLKIYYAMGNYASGTADTATAIVDRSSGTNNGVGTSLAVPSTDGIPATFKDSSSANSIHHALVSGGGVHHTKAVTLSSDGTNGTSTTDQNGNTIYWCGSNSSVTFANSSSFDYGNTSIFFNNIAGAKTYKLDIADSTNFEIDTADFTIDFWEMTHMAQSDSVAFMGKWASGQKDWAIWWNNGSSGDINFAYSTDGSSQTRLDMTPTSNVKTNTWHHFSVVRAGGYLSFYLDGIQKYSVANTADMYNGTAGVEVGYNQNAGNGNLWYMDEMRFIRGSGSPPRFYLGNQTPESGGSLSAFKYADLDGTADYYSKSVNDWQVGDTQGTIVVWFKPDVDQNSILFSSSKAGTDNFFQMGLQTSRRMKMQTDVSGSSYVNAYNASRAYEIGRWNCFALQGDGTKYRLWHNGWEMTYTTAGTASQGTWLNATTDRQNIMIGGMTRGSAEYFFNGGISQVAYWGGSSGTDGILTPTQIKAIYDLGPGADLTTSYNSNLDGYWSFTKTTGGTSTTSTLYDHSSGSDDDMTGTSVTTITTAYLPGTSDKRLSLGASEYSSSSTTAFGNNHYANVAPQSVTGANFGGFVDDEYTVLLLRGGNYDSNTHFTDGGVAAGETITFPAHSYSYGKSRTARIINTGGNPTHLVVADRDVNGSVIDFDGSGDYLLPPGDDAYTIPTGGDFCIEMWLYADATLSNDYFFDARGNPAVGTNFRWYFGSNTDMHWGLTNDVDVGSDALPAGVKVVNTTWTHIAVNRFNNQVMTFQDGRCVDSREDSGAHAGGQPIGIGTNNAGNQTAFDGKIDELRFTNGIARYTPAGELQSGIVPAGATGAGSLGTAIPTSPYLRPTPFVAADGGRGYFANTNVKLWVKSDTYPGDTTFVDHAGAIGQTATVITNYGHTAAARPTLQTGTGDYALSGGSDGIKFDGSNDFIQIPFSPDFYFDSSDFTIEGWFNPADNDTILSWGAASNDFSLMAHNSVGWRAEGQKWNGTSAITLDEGSGDAKNQGWQHIIIQRENTMNTLFVNGISADAQEGDTWFSASGGAYSPLYIGRNWGGTSYHVGSIDEFRISKMARYTSQGLIDSAYPNPSTEFGIQTDGSTYGDLDTQVTANTTYQRYNYRHDSGPLCGNFNGTDVHASRTTANFRSSDDRGTILAWINKAGSDSSTIFGSGDTASGTKYFQFWGQRMLRMAVQDGTGEDGVLGSTTLSDFGWSLVGAVSSGTAWTLYVNGFEDPISTITDANNGKWLSDVADRDVINIGKLQTNSSSEYMDGQIAQVGIWGGSSGTTGVLTAAQILAIYKLGPTANWNTAYSTDMVGYWAFGNVEKNGSSIDLVSANWTIYDQSSGSSNLTTGNFPGAGVQTSLHGTTKFLVHSNETIDGDTTIVDSSRSKHLIDRVVADPVYHTRPAALTGLGNQTANTCIYGGDNRYDYISFPHDNSLAAGNANVATQFTIAGWMYVDSEAAYNDVFNKGGAFQFGRQAGTDTMALFIGGVDEKGGTFNEDTWYHAALTRGNGTSSAEKLEIRLNNSVVATESATGWDADVTYATEPVKVNYNSSASTAYVDQVLFYTGVKLSSTYLGHLYGGGNGNTTFGTLGGVILHEEYSDGTNTANAATAILLHSNNATHHTKGSRYFYNDVANTRFTGTTGHEHAGYFTVGVSGTAFTVLGAHQSNYSPAMTQPSLRLRRGYSYIFAASSLGSHKFYFANSTANSTGYAYGSDASTNKHITGMYVSDTAPTVANKDSLTWTAMTSSHYLGSTDSNGFTYLKYEVPTDAPKDLYYRCGAPHGAMGNAVFVMEATEPAPAKVGTLPVLKDSTWNDRDYAGIGTNKSVMAFGELSGTGVSYVGSDRWLTVPDHADFNLGSTFTFDFWFKSAKVTDQTFYSHATNGSVFWYFYRVSGGSSLGIVQNGSTVTRWKQPDGSNFGLGWYHIVLTCTSGALALYVNGVKSDQYESSYSAVNSGHSIADYSGVPSIGLRTSENNSWLSGFLDEFIIHKGIAYNANTVIERYQAGRAGNHFTANNSCVLHIKSDTTYGNTTFTDSSVSAHTITNVGGIYHHIDDNRTANTALYFDGKSYIAIPNIADADQLGKDVLDIGIKDFTAECWAKPDLGTATQYIMSNGGEGNSNVDGWNIAHIAGTSTGWRPTYEEGGNHSWSPSSVGVGYSGAGMFFTGVWHHLAYVRHNGVFLFLVDGVCVMKDTTETSLNITGTQIFYIGRNHHASDAYFKGFLDGIRVTKGMGRYTDGIPVDGQSPDKRYDDGRSSNIHSTSWSSSSTRRYYGINTHTYLQTTEYSTANANTVILLRGDDAETANDGVNMYGDIGFHLEFKDVGAGTERDYNNFHTSTRGLGSDTSATGEFADDQTAFFLRSRPNQANGSVTFINEVEQKSVLGGAGTRYHTAATSIFSVDSNTANVSISSGGTRTY